MRNLAMTTQPVHHKHSESGKPPITSVAVDQIKLKGADENV